MTQAGWYPDPEQSGQQRYWDGLAWTEHRAPEVLATPPAHYQQQRAGIVTSDKQVRVIQAPIAWVIAVLTFGYMLPWAIAATRGKSNTGAIGWLNLLLGWTFIGWVVALVMACGSHQRYVV